MKNQIIFATLLEQKNIEWIKTQSTKKNCNPSTILNELIQKEIEQEKSNHS